MNIGHCIEVLNPYDWLPGYGENKVELITKGSDLAVSIFYESESGDASRELVFNGVSSFYKSSFPGPYLLNMHTDVKNAAPLTSLVEYPESEGAKLWMQHYSGSRIVKHYSIIFTAENINLIVFATGFSLSEATPSAT